MRPFRKSDLEGYVEIDHREAPAFTDQEAVAMGRPYLVGGLRHFKAATLTCNHCDQINVKNPLRTRERGFCYQCDHFICDGCAVTLKLTGECRCREKRIAEHMQREHLKSLFGPAAAAPVSGLILP